MFEADSVQTFRRVNMVDIPARKKGVATELGDEDMGDYIRRQMAAEFDAMTARDRWLHTTFKRQTERTSTGLEHGGRSAEAGGQAAAKEALQINRKSGREVGQEVIKDMRVILL
jgi:hypothetical protein